MPALTPRALLCLVVAWQHGPPGAAGLVVVSPTDLEFAHVPASFGAESADREWESEIAGARLVITEPLHACKHPRGTTANPASGAGNESVGVAVDGDGESEVEAGEDGGEPGGYSEPRGVGDVRIAWTEDDGAAAAGAEFVVLMARGSCNFTEKVAWAQSAGAAGAIIYDSQSRGDRWGVIMSGDSKKKTEINIAAVFVSYETGEKLLELVRGQAS